MFFMGEPAVWVERMTQLCMYRWSKFKSLLEKRNLGTLVVIGIGKRFNEF